MTKLLDAFVGSLVADALAMPGHWYYDRQALRRDYGWLSEYTEPRNPHPDSILWRSHYKPNSEEADILHDQAKYWGQRGIHYHQFLKAGESTVNLKLAVELYLLISRSGVYDTQAWLERYIELMRTPGWHGDTYVEEYHRGFFERLANGKSPEKCGIRDEHIGGLSQVPALVSALAPDFNTVEIVKQHVALTHRHSNVLRAAGCLTRLILAVEAGSSLRDAIMREAGDWISTRKVSSMLLRPDTEIIGSVYSPACYIDQSFPAALYLAFKYHDDFSAGIIANAMVGGDNCHRGVVVGALLGVANSIEPKWFEGLKAKAVLSACGGGIR